MVDYIRQQWLALCDVNEWGATLCADLRQLLLTWLNQDADVLYARGCVPNARCDKHRYNRSVCWSRHLLQPGRRDVHMLLVQCNGSNLRGMVSKYQTSPVVKAALNQDRRACIYVKFRVVHARKKQPGYVLI